MLAEDIALSLAKNYFFSLSSYNHFHAIGPEEENDEKEWQKLYEKNNIFPDQKLQQSWVSLSRAKQTKY